MTKDRKNKTTSFKTNDAYEKRMLAWVEEKEKGSFSKYIKRLISRDMDNAGRPVAHVAHVAPEAAEELDFSSFV